MKNMKGCTSTQIHQLSISKNRRHPSAGTFYTSSAGAVISLILMGVTAFVFSLTGATNLFGLNGSASATTSTITLSVTGGIGVSVMPSGSGTFASSTATNNVSVKTNSASGYELGIKASNSGSNNNALINTTDSSKIIPSITENVSEADYSDASYASSHNLNNTWGFKPSKLNSQANSNYIPGPTSTTTSTIIDKTTTANPSTFNDYTITLGTRIDNTQTPGAYANTFVITAVANPTPYTITYNKNTTDTVTNMPANVSSDTFSDQVTISNLVPVRDGFNFKGWCTVQVADGGTCTGTTYNPDGGGTALTWTLDQTQASNSLTLYAMWGVSSINLYDAVASMSKGTQTEAELRATITKDNSGVYEYNSSVFGISSDASNDKKIYYYRGILDNTVGSYGSDGDNAAWPNTVLLDTTGNGKDTSDTCWRIVRTTGSGGVKMIYQGKWTGSTCANSREGVKVATTTFNGTSSTDKQIVRVGYTYNSTYATNTASTATIANVFGTNSNPGVNNTRSTIKEYIEDTWYANNMASYTPNLEPNAGYCNDRTMNTSISWTTPLSETTSIITYGTAVTQYYSGSTPRTSDTAQKPTLACAKYSNVDRSTVDLYRYVSGSTGISNQLKYPTALITADEAAFAGSGYSASTTPFHRNSYLRSMSHFWLLSPGGRFSGGAALVFSVGLSGDISYGGLASNSLDVRPAISLSSRNRTKSGTGTATDPWIVNPVKTITMQEFTASDCYSMSTGESIILVDSRDGEEYNIGKLSDGKCWMLDNLRLDLTNSITINSLSTSNTNADSDSLTSLKSGNRNAGAKYATDGFVAWNQGNTSNVYSQAKANADYKNTTTSSYGSGSGKIGVYYNYCAASAGSYCYDQNAGTGKATHDLCPKGWHIPTSGSSGEYQDLYTTYSSNPTNFKNAFSASLSGNFNSGSPNYQGTYGYVWSSTLYSTNNMYRLGLSASGVNPSNNYLRAYGASIRCMKDY